MNGSDPRIPIERHLSDLSDAIDRLVEDQKRYPILVTLENSTWLCEEIVRLSDLMGDVLDAVKSRASSAHPHTTQ